jgi:two-component system, cell cycle sensor histidine kinase and response regulator CckA
MRVLIVDDNETNRKLIRVTVRGGGHDTEEAGDGIEALGKLSAGRFDAVITDILMPRMDGYRLCYRIRHTEAIKDILIIVYSSTYTSESDEQVAVNVGADLFLRKPASPDTILAALGETARGRKPRQKPVAPAAELEALKEYSEGLVRRLEAANRELEVARDGLAAAYDALRESEKKHRELVAFAPIGIFRSTREGRFVSANLALARLLGYESVEELLARNTPQGLYASGEDRERLIAAIGRPGGVGNFEALWKRRDGSPAWVRLDSRVVQGESGGIEYETFVHEIDQRKKAEEKLRHSEENYRLLFEKNPAPMWVFDSETLAFLAVNEASCRHYGYTRQEFLGGMTLRDIRPAEDIPVLETDIARRVPEIRQTGPWRHRKKDGTLIDVEITASPFSFDGREARLILITDVTDRLRAEESVQKLLQAVEQAVNVVFITDPAGRITYVNPAFETLYGHRKEDVLGRTPRVLKSGRHDADFYAKFWRRLTSGERVREEMVNRTRDGRLVDVEMSANPIVDGDGRISGFVAVQNDVTERKLLEHQYRQAQKTEAVGQLAGGVAHDFNNLLTAILGYAELLALKLKDRPRDAEDVEQIRKAGERAASLTRQLLAFSRQQVFERKVLDVNRLIGELEKMFRRLIGEDIDLVTVLDPELAAVSADAGQLEQVVMNLVVNARDAMPRGGKLTIETANVSLDEAYARMHPPVRPGQFAMISVSDSGVGMDAETRSRIFEPFFTTKELGKGTGLGLATVYGIVKQSGGYIWVYSEPGKGASFKVYLPVAGEEPAAETVSESERPLQGRETLLLVEDEASVRTLTRSILESYGYDVLEAGTPEEALGILDRRRSPVHLLLTDVVMPVMGGPDLASRIERVRPGIKVLYMSGYTDDSIFRHGHLKRGSLFLQKPFTPEALARKVRDALGR